MNYEEVYLSPSVVWFIEGGDKNIIVDTGITAEGVKRYRSYRCDDIMSFKDALAKVGTSPEKIDIVIQTHLHYDHCWNTAQCINAKIIVQESELNYARSPHPVHSHSYDLGLIKDLQLVTVNGDTEIAEGITVLLTPGHTPGGQSVAIDTAKGKAIITGFCAIAENFNPPVSVKSRSSVLPGWLYYDLFQWLDSAVKVQEMADIIIPDHDLEISRMDVIPAVE